MKAEDKKLTPAKDPAKRPSIERLRELFSYDPIDGLLRYKVWRGSQVPGDVAGSLGASYFRVGINHNDYFVHVIIWAILKGYWPVFQIDHKDTNRKNNHIENLREATQSLNNMNSKLRVDNKIGHKGVHKRPNRIRNPWVARIGRNNIGHFPTMEEAIAARIAEENKQFGEFARRS